MGIPVVSMATWELAFCGVDDETSISKRLVLVVASTSVEKSWMLLPVHPLNGYSRGFRWLPPIGAMFMFLATGRIKACASCGRMIGSIIMNE